MEGSRSNLKAILEVIRKEDPAMFFWLAAVVLLHGAQRMWGISIVRYLLSPLLDGSAQVFLMHTGTVILVSALLAVLTGTAEKEVRKVCSGPEILEMRRTVRQVLAGDAA